MKLPIIGSMFNTEHSTQAENKKKINKTLRLIDDERSSLLPEVEQKWLESDWTILGDDLSGATISALATNNGKTARSRHAIYQQWRLMESDPIISIALKTHVIAALGGHETSGKLIFIEDSPDATEADKTLLDELRMDLETLLNSVAFNLCYNGVAFGDAFARTYFEKGKGLTHLIADEMTHPTLIVPYERAGDTVGYMAGTNQNQLVRLTTHQIARLKMPRIAVVPQMGIFPKAYRINIAEDDVNKLPSVPSMVGGSLLFAAEKPFNDLYLSMNAIVGQRWVDSIDESIFTFNMTGGTKEQQKKFKENIRKTFERSKEIADKAMIERTPHFGRIRHILFTHQEKQAGLLGDPLGSRRANSITIDDIMMHARLMAGALGIDLSLLGFADQLSGGLGDGGFFRTSAQIGEWTRLIRTAFTHFAIRLIDNHMLFKYGKKWEKGKHPFEINFYGSISAFESEKQKTKADSIGTAGIMVQTFDQIRNLNFSKEQIALFMTKQMALDEDEALTYAEVLAQKAEEIDNGGDYGR